MTATLITNIGELTTNVEGDGDPTGLRRDAAVLVEGSRIAWVGSAAEAETHLLRRDSAPQTTSRDGFDVSPSSAGGGGHVQVVDAGGRAVIPGFVDSHTHLVFGGDRADEFEARMTGTP